jgi:hypothetical protein
MTLAAVGSTLPGLSLDDVFTPLGREILAGTFDTQPVHHLNDTLARLHLLRGPVLNFDQSKLPTWLAAMSSASAGHVRPRCPVLMCVDGFKGGTVIPVSWQQQYAKQVTALGGDISTKTYPDDDHFSLPVSCAKDALQWLQGLVTS